LNFRLRKREKGYSRYKHLDITAYIVKYTQKKSRLYNENKLQIPESIANDFLVKHLS